jgi:DNA-binding SARP family transcriptional activator
MVAEMARGIRPGMPGPAPAAPEILDIRCLGLFRLRIGDAVVPREAFRRRRALTLLEILLVHDGRAVHRDELVAILCPEADDASATRLLASALHYLRRALHLPGHEAVPCIRHDGAYWSFDAASPHLLDWREFETGIDHASRLAAWGHATEALSAYQQALGYYTGDLLADEPESDWCEADRSALRERYLTALMACAALHLASGDAEPAIACYRQALRTDPAREDIQAALMRALWQAGRRAEALRQFDDLATVLDRECDTVPAAATRRLYDEIARDA